MQRRHDLDGPNLCGCNIKEFVVVVPNAMPIQIEECHSGVGEQDQFSRGISEMEWKGIIPCEKSILQ